MTHLEYTEARVKDIFVDFLKGFKDPRNELKYRTAISGMPGENLKSIVVDYPDLLAFNTDLATSILKQPELFLKAFDLAAIETLTIENPVFADKVKKELHVRLRELTDRISLRGVTKENLNMLILVAGMVTRTSELRPLAVTAAFRCSSDHITRVDQSGSILKKPIKCEEEGCGETKNFELDDMETEFVDFQVIRIQEMPEELPPGQLPQSFDVHLLGDVVNSARPGDRIVLTGIVKAEPAYAGTSRLREFTNRIIANYVEQQGKRPEEIEIDREEEEKIKAIAAAPGSYDRLINSVAPAIFGHELHKEAALMLMVGSPQKTLPDGSTLRGDINLLLVGDPGCLVADERVVLGNGTIAKIGWMGKQHLESISTSILTGRGGAKRARATRFHVYRNQPVREIITESGKSLIGTLNHPVLARKREAGSRETEWRRLDEFQVGDRVVVTTGFPCTVTKYVSTGFKPIERKSKFGPSFKGKFPNLVDPKLAALLGYMLGDGWVRKTGEQSGFVVADPDKDILPSLVKIATELFGLKVHIISKIGPKRSVLLYYAVINSIDVAANLSFLQTKRVPDLILASGNKAVASFLKWLYEADGTVFRSRSARGVGCVGLKSAQLELLRDVQILLLRFGIHSRIIGTALVIRRGGGIEKFAKKIGFASKRKQAKLIQLLVDGKEKRQFHGQRLERIVKILERPTQDVYDIEVPQEHQFIANGIISHNTAKSELLKYVARIAPRGLYTSGRGTTAAGLTAAVVKEKNGMMMLEAGATVLADLGIACLHPSCTIIFNNKVITIEDLASKTTFISAISGGEPCELGKVKGLVPSFDLKEFKAETTPTSILRRKRYSGKLVQIKLRSGFGLCLTPDHKLLDGNTLEWKEAAAFSEKDLLVSPLLLPDDYIPRSLFLWDILPDDSKVSLNELERSSLRPLIESKYGTLTNAGRVIGIERLPQYYRQRLQPTLAELKSIANALGIEESWRRMSHVFDQSELLVSEITPELAYICGFIFGDGWVKVTERHAQITIHQSNVHLAQIKHLEEYWNRVFKVPFRVGTPRKETSEIRGRKVTSNAYNWHMSRRVLANIYEYLTGDNLAKLVGLPRELLASFISGLVDSDGCFAKKTCPIGGKKYHTWNLIFTISSEEKANLNLLLALRRFDCLGSYRGNRRGVGIVTISGRRDCEQLQHVLSPYSLKMKEIPAQRLHNVSALSEKLPAIPVRDSLIRILENMNRSLLVRNGIWSIVYEYSHLKRQPASGQVLKILSKNLEIQKDERNTLIKLARRDYFLDEIQNICETPYEGYVYDLVVRNKNHNFVADGVFVHNCIDEFDKMRDEDRSALHEVMEQQTASVAKGGIIATLNARTSILAAANPADGKYDPYKNILDNVLLPVPLLTRFDLIFIIRDEPDAAKDENVAKHILDMRAKSSFPVTPPIEFDLLKKYIIYAKKLDPELTEEARERLSSFYIKMRREAAPDQLSVTPRWLEGLIRLSIARSRVLLHTRVTDEDALNAIKLMERMLQTVAVDQATKKVDIGVLYNKPISEKGLRETALEVFKRLSGETKQPVEDKAFYDEMEKTGKFNREQSEKVFQDMWKSGVIYESKPHFFKKA